MRLKLLLAYVGTAYCGWQIQEKPSPPPTVQGTLEAALHRLVGSPVRVFGSGRTDSGVHAAGQVAHCDVPEGRIADWRHSLNAILPADIRVVEASSAPATFHARKQAVCKTYTYQFWQEGAFCPPQLAPFVWQCGRLDAQAMRAALPALTGELQCASLQNAGTDMESTIRTIHALTLEEMPGQEFFPAHAPLLRLSVTANGFLKQMVRNMAGLLAWIGQGKIDAAAVPGILAQASRAALPSPTAPAQGLCLVHVAY